MLSRSCIANAHLSRSGRLKPIVAGGQALADKCALLCSSSAFCSNFARTYFKATANYYIKQHFLEAQRFLCMTQHVPVIKHLTPFSAVTSAACSTCVITHSYFRIGALVAVFSTVTHCLAKGTLSLLLTFAAAASTERPTLGRWTKTVRCLAAGVAHRHLISFALEMYGVKTKHAMLAVKKGPSLVCLW